MDNFELHPPFSIPTPAYAPREGRHTARLSLLNELSIKLQTLLDAPDFYPQLVEMIQKHFQLYSVQIWSLREGTHYQLRAHTGAYRPHLAIGHNVPLTQGICGIVARTRRSHLCNDISKEPLFTNLALPIDTQSQLTVPVVNRGSADHEIFAMINIESDRSHAFNADDLASMESIAAQVSVAISNRRLFRQVKHFSDELQSRIDEKTLELRRANEQILGQQQELKRENTALKTLVQQEMPHWEIVGQSPPLLDLLTVVDKIAPTSATVLIEGESGTGKELIARRLHQLSDRVHQPFITVHCGALQDTLLESELFGHERGAFTGAVSQKIGLCETAHGGTLFLDEVGELTPATQTKLLRFLQEGEFYRVGGKRPIQVKVRIISATNRVLQDEVRSGTFREDLMYRLNMMSLRMPALRERRDDIPILAEYFLKYSRYGGQSSANYRVASGVFESLQNYNWPGNIRELQNTVERLKILADNHEIRLEDLPTQFHPPVIARPHGQHTESATSSAPFSLPLQDIEREYVLGMLAHQQGNKTKAAQSLGITVKTLYNKLQRYHINS